MRKFLILEIDREQGNKEKTRLTYNCAHVRSTKESVTFRYTEEGKYISFAEKRKTKRKMEEIFVWEEKEDEENTRDWSVPDRSDKYMMI